MKRPWWVKIFFDDFCSHYFGMNEEDIVKDVKDSIKALLEKDPSGNSLGAKMVRQATERVAQKSETYRNNVNSRWHPESQPKAPAPKSAPAKFPSVSEVYDFALLNGLDSADARDFYEMTFTERGGKDINGKPVMNWKGMLKRFCDSRAKRRNEDGR